MSVYSYFTYAFNDVFVTLINEYENTCIQGRSHPPASLG